MANFLQTENGEKIAYNLFEVKNPGGLVLMIPMMPAVKESWNELAEKLREQGFESLAIDLRGHGESSGGPDGYLNFSDQEHQAGILDLSAAADFLIRGMPERFVKQKKITLIGASIGANLVLQYLSEHLKIKKAVLLSAGLNYRGIETLPLAKKLKKGQEIFFISARDDSRAGGNNAEQNQKIYDLIPDYAAKKIKIYETGGHGTNLFKSHPELFDLIIEFIQK